MKYRKIRILSVIMACLLAIACLFAGCSKEENGGGDTPPDNQQPGGEPEPPVPEGDGYPTCLRAGCTARPRWA